MYCYLYVVSFKPLTLYLEVVNIEDLRASVDHVSSLAVLRSLIMFYYVIFCLEI